MVGTQDFWSGWRERLSALRNVPPVLKIVWQSGPGVVTFGLVARVIAALLPLALTWIPKLIIDILVLLISTHGPIPSRLWWLAVAAFALPAMSLFATPLTTYPAPLQPNH